jgi:hypothetical protein
MRQRSYGFLEERLAGTQNLELLASPTASKTLAVRRWRS